MNLSRRMSRGHAASGKQELSSWSARAAVRLLRGDEQLCSWFLPVEGCQLGGASLPVVILGSGTT